MPGPWSAGATYQKLDEATYTGQVWVSKEDNNLGHNPLSSPGWWKEKQPPRPYKRGTMDEVIGYQ